MAMSPDEVYGVCCEFIIVVSHPPYKRKKRKTRFRGKVAVMFIAVFITERKFFLPAGLIMVC